MIRLGRKVMDLIVSIKQSYRGRIVGSATTQDGDNDVTILARFLSKDSDHLPKTLARYILNLTISDRDKARMHGLAVRNQADNLTSAEKEEMDASRRASTVLSILKSKPGALSASS
jgi:hypothetical protein